MGRALFASLSRLRQHYLSSRLIRAHSIAVRLAGGINEVPRETPRSHLPHHATAYACRDCHGRERTRCRSQRRLRPARRLVVERARSRPPGNFRQGGGCRWADPRRIVSDVACASRLRGHFHVCRAVRSEITRQGLAGHEGYLRINPDRASRCQTGRRRPRRSLARGRAQSLFLCKSNRSCADRRELQRRFARTCPLPHP